MICRRRRGRRRRRRARQRPPSRRPTKKTRIVGAARLWRTSAFVRRPGLVWSLFLVPMVTFCSTFAATDRHRRPRLELIKQIDKPNTQTNNRRAASRIMTPLNFRFDKSPIKLMTNLNQTVTVKHTKVQKRVTIFAVSCRLSSALSLLLFVGLRQSQLTFANHFSSLVCLVAPVGRQHPSHLTDLPPPVVGVTSARCCCRCLARLPVGQQAPSFEPYTCTNNIHKSSTPDTC